jgi:hypothetical protein
MTSTVKTLEFEYRGIPFWLVSAENSAFATPSLLCMTERDAWVMHRERVEQFEYWHHCQEFLGQITAFDDGEEKELDDYWWPEDE